MAVEMEFCQFGIWNLNWMSKKILIVNKLKNNLEVKQGVYD